MTMNIIWQIHDRFLEMCNYDKNGKVRLTQAEQNNTFTGSS